MTTHPQFNTKSPTIKRILKEASELATHPSPDHHAAPLDSNLFEWHFTLRGPPSPSPYSSGIYHGRIILPPTYPLRPPSFRFLTPTGRFEVNREICLSISGHHEETWQPAWGIRTALVAIRSFMDSESRGQVGGLECGEGTRRALARESAGWRCGGCGGRTNAEIMGELVEMARARDGMKGEGREEVQVPRELRLAYREELGKETKGARTGTGTRLGTGEAEIEGQTVTGMPDANAPVDTSKPEAQDPSPQPIRTIPAQLQTQPQAQLQPQLQPPQTTQQHPHPNAPQPPSHQPQPQSQTQTLTQAPTRNRNQDRNHDSAVPAWLDRAIVGVAVSLAVMVCRKLVYL